MEIKSKEIKTVGIDSIIPNPKNPNTHSKEQIKRLCKLIENTGFRNPLVVSNQSGFLIVGHGRLEAAKIIGMKEVPVIFQDFKNEADEYAYMTADNALASWSELDLEKINKEILNFEDFDMELLGIEDFKIIEPEIIPLCDEDEVPEVKNPITKRGDIWLLGNHRLMCGDSTMIDDVEKLLDGESIDMVFTDPPYNIDYQDMNKEFSKIKNDKMSDDEFLSFLKDCLSVECDTFYICCSWQYAHVFKKAMEDIDKPVKSCIVWNKVNHVQHLDKYFKQHEFILYHEKFGGQKTLRGDIWECKRQVNTLHPTMKPIELIDMAMQDNEEKKIVYDAFGGSGSTLISCEKNRKKARLMELEPKYCDVIINRWQNFTGKKAFIESNGKTYEELKNG